MDAELMSANEEAHWRYQLELMTNWSHANRYVGSWNKPPEEVIWLGEEARYKVHLANAQHRRADRLVSPNDLF